MTTILKYITSIYTPLYYSSLYWDNGKQKTTIMENQMEQNMENDMETGIIMGYIACVEEWHRRGS